MKKIFKLFVIIACAATLIFVVAAFTLITNTGFRYISLPIVNILSPVKIRIKNWRFIPWKSLRVKGITVSDIPKATGSTNLFISAEFINLRYDFFSLFSDEPVFHLAEARGMRYIIDSRGTATVKEDRPHKKRESDKKKSGEKESEPGAE